MARAIGANAQLLGKFEAAYGTAPGGAYARLPFISCDLGSEQPLEANDVLGLGRDPPEPSRGVVDHVVLESAAQCHQEHQPAGLKRPARPGLT
ncbi:hypothetical protein WCLP8_1200003 [uncultured Gammaproteobacteria bacterium]